LKSRALVVPFLALALAGCSAGAQPGVYRSVEDLVKDYEKAGGDCSGRQDRGPFGHAAAVVDCGDDILSVYPDQHSLLTRVTEHRRMRASVDSYEVTPWRIGENWSIRSDRAAEYGELGGRVERL
jgi:hypothetical protein